MKIHLKQIPVEGLHLEGEEEGDILDLQAEGVQVRGPVRFSVDVGLSGDGLFATGRLEADFRLECVTCLGWFDYTVEVPDFAVQIPLGGAELVDLTEEVREDILLALPPYPHCDWNGGKACPGVRTATISSEKSEQNRGDKARERSEPEGEKNPWTRLDDLGGKLPKPNETNLL